MSQEHPALFRRARTPEGAYVDEFISSGHSKTLIARHVEQEVFILAFELEKIDETVSVCAQLRKPRKQIAVYQNLIALHDNDETLLSGPPRRVVTVYQLMRLYILDHLESERLRSSRK